MELIKGPETLTVSPKHTCASWKMSFAGYLFAMLTSRNNFLVIANFFLGDQDHIGSGISTWDQVQINSEIKEMDGVPHFYLLNLLAASQSGIQGGSFYPFTNFN